MVEEIYILRDPYEDYHTKRSYPPSTEGSCYNNPTRAVTIKLANFFMDMFDVDTNMAIFSSSANNGRSNGIALQRYFPFVPLYFREELKERQIGNEEDLLLENISQKGYERNQVYTSETLPEPEFEGVESLIDFQRRITRIGKEIIRREEEIVIVSGHEFSNSALINFLTGEGLVYHQQAPTKVHYLVRGNDGNFQYQQTLNLKAGFRIYRHGELLPLQGLSAQTLQDILEILTPEQLRGLRTQV